MSELAAILFTDIVGSTELRSDLGEDAADELRRRHEADLSAAVEVHQGRVVKTLGDGVMAVFAGVADAVAAGVAAQQATREPLRIRVGISAGDVALEDGDAHGTPVIEAARLCAAAASEQILCSAPVQWMSRGRGDHTFVPIGDLELKGLPDPVPALEVRWVRTATSDGGAGLPAALAGDLRFPFVGREQEREALVDAWKQVDADRGRRVILLAGEPGVGKTSLAGAAARVVLDRGGTVLFGRCDEDVGLPFQPFAEALRQYVSTVPADDVAALGVHPGDLARVLPELADQFPDLPPPLTSDPDTERYRLFEAVAAWLVTASADAAALLVLDDLHWAAKPTLLLLRHLTRTTTAARLVIVGTYRDTDLDRTHPLAEILADLRREPAVERIALRGLDPAGVAAFLEAAGGHDLDEAGEALAAAIAAETEGNPFFVGEVLANLVETGALYERDGRWTSDHSIEEMAIPEGVREVVGRRLSRLAGDTNDTLTRAAVIGHTFERRVLGAVCDLGDDAVDAALEEAGAAGLVRESDDVFGHRFSHALVRSTLYEELPTARRVRLHRRVGEAIESVHRSRLDDRVADLAYHFGEAAVGGEVDKAVGYASRAATAAQQAGAWDQALVWHRRALDLHEAEFGTVDSVERVDLLIALGRVELELGVDGHRQHLFSAMAAAERLSDTDRMVAAVLANSRGGYSAYGQVDHERIAAVEGALDAVGEGHSVDRARLLALLVGELTFAGEPERQAALYDEAVALARPLDDPRPLSHVLLQRENTLHDPAAIEDRLVTTAESLAQADLVDDPVGRIYARTARGILLLEHGDGPEYRHLVDETVGLAEGFGLPRLQWQGANLETSVRLLDGDLTAAEAAADRARGFAVAAHQPEADLTYASAITLIRGAQGRSEELTSDLEVLVAASPRGLLAVWVAVVLTDAGRDDEAGALLDSAELSVDLLTRENVPALVPVATWAEAVARLGRANEAHALYEALLPASGQLLVVTPGWAMAGGDEMLGRLAPLAGFPERVDGHLGAALAIADRVASPWLRAKCELGWGEAKVAAGDPSAARPHLGAAIALSEEHGFAGYATRARALLG